MKGSIVALAAIGINTATAQIKVADYFPECAVDCVNDVLGTATTSDPEDSICLCLHSNQYKIYAAAEQCAIDACGYDVAQREFSHPDTTSY